MKNAKFAMFLLAIAGCDTSNMMTISPCTPGDIEHIPCGNCMSIDRFCTLDQEWMYGECEPLSQCEVSDAGIQDGGEISLNADVGGDAFVASEMTDSGSEVSLDATISSEMYCLEFDGAGSFIELSGMPSFGSSFTIEAWVNPDTVVQPTNVGGYIFNRKYPFEDIILSYSRDGDGRFSFLVNRTVLTSEIPSSPGIWHHVAATYSAPSRMQLFVDGHLAGNATTSVVLNHPEDTFFIGWEGAAEEGYLRGSFFGRLDEIRVSSVVRYDSSFIPEIHLYSDVNSVSFLLNEGSGSTVFSNISSAFGSINATSWQFTSR